MKVFLVFIVGLIGFSTVKAQDTVRIMYYNLLNFPDDSPERVVDLRKIIAYTQPDIIVVNELLSLEGANLILTDALNVFGTSHYNAATYYDGPDTDNMLYYNSEKLGLLNQVQVPTGLRDISEYQLYYKQDDLHADTDTIYLTVYSLHLKAGSGHYNQRKEEVLVLKYRLNDISNYENILAGGDFNFYSGNESGCLAMRESGGNELFDPINSIGNWNNNASYASIHTQSTRSAALSDGAGGGLDDRFDIIFCSEDVLNNANGLRYIPGSYKAVGQDGFRFNGSINSPYNASVPDSISNALFYMSDHLPVIMDLATDKTASISNNDASELRVYYKSSTNTIALNSSHSEGVFQLYDLSGKLVLETGLNSENQIPLPASIHGGIYIWKISDGKSIDTGKVSVH